MEVGEERKKPLDSVSGDKVRVFVYARSLRYSCALLRSLKKSDASAAVRPVMVTSFLSGWYLRTSCR